MKNTQTQLPILRIGIDILYTGHFLNVIRRPLPGGWSFAGEWPTFFASPQVYRRFRRSLGDDQPSFSVYLLRTDSETLSVVGIAPGTGTTTISEQRAILDDFRACVLDLPKLRQFPQVIVEPEKLADFDPPPAVQKLLEKWRSVVNQGAGFHPFDPTAWDSLLVALRLTRRSISFDWLIDAFALKHTIHERALQRLHNSFGSSMDLLQRYDEGLEFKRDLDRKRAGTPSAASINPQPSAIN